MSSEQTANRVALSARIVKSGEVAMVSCRRCESKGWDCKLSSFSLKCSACVLSATKCEAAEIAPPDFATIDRAMERLEKEELEAEAVLDAAAEQIRVSRAKLRRLRKQKKFLKDREKKLFDKGLSDVEEFERLEELEKANEVQRAAEAASSVDDFLTSGALSPGSLSWLDQFAVDGTLEGAPGSS